jgi:hypothetical protein
VYTLLYFSTISSSFQMHSIAFARVSDLSQVLYDTMRNKRSLIKVVQLHHARTPSESCLLTTTCIHRMKLCNQRATRCGAERPSQAKKHEMGVRKHEIIFQQHINTETFFFASCWTESFSPLLCCKFYSELVDHGQGARIVRFPQDASRHHRACLCV